MGEHIWTPKWKKSAYPKLKIWVNFIVEIMNGMVEKTWKPRENLQSLTSELTDILPLESECDWILDNKWYCHILWTSNYFGDKRGGKVIKRHLNDVLLYVMKYTEIVVGVLIDCLYNRSHWNVMPYWKHRLNKNLILSLITVVSDCVSFRVFSFFIKCRKNRGSLCLYEL